MMLIIDPVPILVVIAFILYGLFWHYLLKKSDTEVKLK